MQKSAKKTKKMLAITYTLHAEKNIMLISCFGPKRFPFYNLNSLSYSPVH